jgi:SPP1 family predicted phage head-tail adaptor
MRIGPLDQRLTIQTPTYASSTQSGQGVASWSTLATVWGAVRAMSGTETLSAGSVTSGVTYEIEVRFRSDVTPKMRVQWTPYSGSAKTFEIHAVQVGTRTSDRLTLLCGVTE